jgi:hypothetical protein
VELDAELVTGTYGWLIIPLALYGAAVTWAWLLANNARGTGWEPTPLPSNICISFGAIALALLVGHFL